MPLVNLAAFTLNCQDSIWLFMTLGQLHYNFLSNLGRTRTHGTIYNIMLFPLCQNLQCFHGCELFCTCVIYVHTSIICQKLGRRKSKNCMLETEKGVRWRAGEQQEIKPPAFASIKKFWQDKDKAHSLGNLCTAAQVPKRCMIFLHIKLYC